MKTYRLLAVSTLLIGLPTAIAAAQEKHRIAYQASAENSKYIQQYTIDVGDIKGHQVRILEVKRVFPKDAPVYEGVKVAEEWNRGYSDYVDGNGRNWGYVTLIMENGDKIFGRWEGNAQTKVGSDGSKKSLSTNTINFSGGTGKFQRIQGVLRSLSTFDASKGFNSTEAEGEYWMDK